MGNQGALQDPFEGASGHIALKVGLLVGCGVEGIPVAGCRRVILVPRDPAQDDERPAAEGAKALAIRFPTLRGT